MCGSMAQLAERSAVNRETTYFTSRRFFPSRACGGRLADRMSGRSFAHPTNHHPGSSHNVCRSRGDDEKLAGPDEVPEGQRPDGFLSCGRSSAWRHAGGKGIDIPLSSIFFLFPLQIARVVDGSASIPPTARLQKWAFPRVNKRQHHSLLCLLRFSATRTAADNVRVRRPVSSSPSISDSPFHEGGVSTHALVNVLRRSKFARAEVATKK
ncbi:hypothetical protein PAPYR_8771 [Paratrimastix pyriformis]|uniref:Uncharacterized protein n=1 Tax=Paratrimastix pyriformis TaxID=342808 RepID=A0ABQ8UBG4_9EUKA|nr:hypothetical protein PAPYR_8771 [Paratrimastix pyriformis]